MRIPGIGRVIEDPVGGSYRSSDPVPVPVLDGAPFHIVIEGYDEDPDQEDFHAAIRTFLALDRSVLTAAAPLIFDYYVDVSFSVDDCGCEIEDPDDVFDHIDFCHDPVVTRNTPVDRHIYVSLECECDWEDEHGMQIVFRDGQTITKVGPYDGHLTEGGYPAE